LDELATPREGFEATRGGQKYSGQYRNLGRDPLGKQGYYIDWLGRGEGPQGNFTGVPDKTSPPKTVGITPESIKGKSIYFRPDSSPPARHRKTSTIKGRERWRKSRIKLFEKMIGGKASSLGGNLFRIAPAILIPLLLSALAGGKRDGISE
jgi:hypothetical protein